MEIVFHVLCLRRDVKAHLEEIELITAGCALALCESLSTPLDLSLNRDRFFALLPLCGALINLTED